MELQCSTDWSLESSILPRTAGDVVSLTEAQKFTWRYYEKQHTAWKLCATCVRVNGRLDIELLKDCIKFIVHRHQALRTSIVSVEGTLRQQVSDGANFQFEVSDLADVPSGNAHGECARLVNEELNRASTLEDSFIRANVWRLSAQESAFTLMIEHMITDAFSNSIMVRELWEAYRQVSKSIPLSFPQASVDFPDYAVWQERTRADWTKKHENWWRTHLENVTRVVIPADADLPERGITKPLRHFPFGKELSGRLRELAATECVPLPIVVLAVYAIVMSHWCKKTDMLIRFVSHGREFRPELKDMIGFIAGILHLRVRLDDQATLADVLLLVHQEFKCVVSHRDFDRVPHLISDLWTDFGLDTTDAFFNWQSGTRARQSIACVEGRKNPLRIQPFPYTVETRPPFTPLFYDTPAGVSVVVFYRTDFLNTSTIDGFGRNLHLVARQITADRAMQLKSLRMYLQ